MARSRTQVRRPGIATAARPPTHETCAGRTGTRLPPTRPRTAAHTPRISEQADISPSERLARRWFAAVARGAFDELPQLVHEDVEIVSKIRAGTVVHGRADVVEFIQETVAPSLYDAAVEVYTPIDAERVIAEGRLRWIDEDRVIRDDPVVWALEFRDELLLRFAAARTTVAAEAILGVAR